MGVIGWPPVSIGKYILKSVSDAPVLSVSGLSSSAPSQSKWDRGVSLNIGTGGSQS